MWDLFFLHGWYDGELAKFLDILFSTYEGLITIEFTEAMYCHMIDANYTSMPNILD